MASETPQKKRFISLRVKLLVGFTLLFMVVFAVAFYWFYTFATDVAMNQIEEDMLTTLYGGLEGIDGDTFAALAEEAELRDDGLSDDPRYWDHMAWIETIHDLEPRANPYSWVRGDLNVQNEVLFIGDILRLTQPENATVFREPYITQGSMITGMLTLWEDLEPYQDDWGYWISAYAPIINSAGESVGGLGIDFRADYVFQVQDSIKSRILVSFAITYLVLFGFVYLLSRTLTGPIIALTGIAREVADGNYGQDISKLYGGKTQDEVDALAQVFELMVSKVRAREEGLKRQVQELRIEIDEVKKARQVAEITESDYFVTLRDKARVLREQKIADAVAEEE
ncbi:MAG: HAMP domain-containing protein [Anaerolineae bacterium]|jgi:HAMP domain-containing protein|nr:HAMP domain-containing protein [Anaerolineae bacterium]